MSKQTTIFDYTEILTGVIQRVAPEAHIAGGAVRDTLLHKPINDIDVFMSDEHMGEAAALLRSACAYVMVGEWKQYLGFSDPAMTRVAKFEKADQTIPICIIGLRPNYANVKANLSRFDFGICMTAFDGKHTIRTEEFNSDAENRTFTLHRADNQQQFAYSMCRYEKITSGRYVGWSLDVPKQFEELVKEHAFRRHWYRDGIKGFEVGENILKPKERHVHAQGIA
jgi:hypothetical protein